MRRAATSHAGSSPPPEVTSDDLGMLLERVADRDDCELTTTGRRTGRAHTVEIWFAVAERSLFIIGDPSRPDWYRNVVAGTTGGTDATVGVRLAGVHVTGLGRPITDPDRRRFAGSVLAAKYRRWLTSEDLADNPTSWAYGGVAIEISGLELRD